MVKVFELIATHALTKSRREFLKLKADIARNGIREPIKYVIFFKKTNTLLTGIIACKRRAS